MSCSNQVVRFALSDANGVFGFDVSSKVEAGAIGLLVRGSTRVGGICTDFSGNIYITDSAQHIVIKVDEGGRVSNFAGTPGVSGNDSSLVATACNSAHFDTPVGICCAKNGDILVADFGNNQIRKISGGFVTNIAGNVSGNAGFIDGVGGIAKFSGPKGICIDNSGTIYVADYTNHAIRKVTLNGTVLTMLGVLGTATSGDLENVQCTKYIAALNSPWSVTVDASGNVYILDTGNRKIKKMTPNGWLYLHSGSGVAGNSLGTAGTTPATCQSFTCQYFEPTSCSVDRSNNLYVIDRMEGYTRLLTVNYNGVPAEIADFRNSAYVDCPVFVTVSPAQKLFVTFSDFETGWSSSSSNSSSSSSEDYSSSSSSSFDLRQ